MATLVVVRYILGHSSSTKAATDEISARWGETVEADGISVSLDDDPGHGCYKLSIGNERWLRSISPDEGGAVIGYTGVQDADVQLFLTSNTLDKERLNWGVFAPIDAGGTETDTVCGRYADPNRIEVDIADTTVAFN